ncbi:MAG TPA: hypothetical protein VK176_02440 [Phycisphaerales bacterium]|nr:hypothetical protein [Phycisphaerales bacterium]
MKPPGVLRTHVHTGGSCTGSGQLNPGGGRGGSMLVDRIPGARTVCR